MLLNILTLYFLSKVYNKLILILVYNATAWEIGEWCKFSLNFNKLCASSTSNQKQEIAPHIHIFPTNKVLFKTCVVTKFVDDDDYSTWHTLHMNELTNKQQSIVVRVYFNLVMSGTTWTHFKSDLMKRFGLRLRNVTSGKLWVISERSVQAVFSDHVS